VRGEDVEAQAGLGEEIAAAWRGGGEDEHNLSRLLGLSF
jgi:hypothetical protein